MLRKMEVSDAGGANLPIGVVRLGRLCLTPVVRVDCTDNQGPVTCGVLQMDEVGLKTILRLKSGGTANEIKNVKLVRFQVLILG
jgi:hypothetical protein